MKKLLKHAKSNCKKAAAATGTAFISAQAWAIDQAKVEADLTAAEADALSTGEMVVGVVASIIVIGLVIAMIRKI